MLPLKKIEKMCAGTAIIELKCERCELFGLIMLFHTCCSSAYEEEKPIGIALKKILRIEMLGVLKVITSDEAVIHFGKKKNGLLLAYLAIHSGQQIYRDDLIDLFWPNVRPDSGKNSLRQCLSNLKHELKSFSVPAGLIILADRKHISLNFDYVETDLHELLSYLAESSAMPPSVELNELCIKISKLYSGQLLKGCEEGWVIAEREKIKREVQLVQLRTNLYDASDSRQTEKNSNSPRGSGLLSSAFSIPEVYLPIFGREQELETGSHLLLSGKGRLLTLHGIGGSGKTRLAIEIGKRVSRELGLPLVWVSLDDYSHWEDIYAGISFAIDDQNTRQQDTKEHVIQLLRTTPCVLVLDNMEHLLGAKQQVDGSAVVSQIIQQTQDVTIITTSRKLMNCGGEQVLTVKPLAVRSLNSAPHETQLSHPAVQLFEARAMKVSPHFELQSQLSDVVELVQKLEGIPLAIELMAAQIRVLSVKQMLDNLGNRLDAVISTRKDLPARHRTLRSVLEYGYSLLTSTLQNVLCKLATFHDGWSLNAAAEICNLDSQEMLELISELEQHSLVFMEKSGKRIRYRMLDTVAQFAREQPESGSQMNQQHALWCLQFVEHHSFGLHGTLSAGNLEELRVESRNINAAINWALRSNSQLAIKLCDYMWHFWSVTGAYSEGHQYLTSCFESKDVKDDALSGRLYLATGVMEQGLGRADRAMECYMSAYTIFKQLDDTSALAEVHNHIGRLAWERGEYKNAHEAYNNALEIWERNDNAVGKSQAYNNLGLVAWHLGNLDDAESYFHKSFEFKRNTDDWQSTAISLNNLALVAHDRGKFLASKILLTDAYKLVKEHKLAIEWHILCNLGRAECSLGNHSSACDHHLAALAARSKMGDRINLTYSLECIVLLLRSIGANEHAAKILGGCDTFRTQLKVPSPPSLSKELNVIRENYRNQENMNAYLQIGGLLPVEAIVEHASETLRSVLKQFQ